MHRPEVCRRPTQVEDRVIHRVCLTRHRRSWSSIASDRAVAASRSTRPVVGGDTLHRREMFADKPALQLVRAYDVADDEIIGTIVASLSSLACQRACLLE